MTRPPRILILALGVYGQEGGIEQLQRNLVRAAARLGEPTLISLWDPPGRPAGLPQGVRFLGAGSGKLRMIRNVLRAALRQPDVVVSSHVLLVPLAAVVKALAPRSRHVLEAHGIEVWDRPTSRSRILVRYCIDTIAAVSGYTASRMAEAYGLPGSRFRVVPPFVEAPPALPERVGGRRLLSVSRLDRSDRYKGIDTVLRAIPLIAKEVPEVGYVVVGDGDWRPELQELAVELGVADRVRFLGRVPAAERDDAYRSSDVFVLPSTAEGFGIVFLEAWRFGLPVIAAADGAASQIVQDGRTGLVAEATPEGVAAAAIRLLSERGVAAAMGASGRALVESTYSEAAYDAAVRSLLVGADGPSAGGASGTR